MARERGLLFGVTYTYTGYAMIRQARGSDRCRRDRQNPDGGGESIPRNGCWCRWSATGPDQATWRMDPARSGPSGCCADIGTHVECLISKMTGLEADSVLARFERLPKDQNLPLENNVQVLVNFKGGVSGMIWTSQVAIGHETDLCIRIFGGEGIDRMAAQKSGGTAGDKDQ